MAAASIVINNMRAVLVKDIFMEDMVDMLGVVSEVAVVYIGTVELEEVEVTLEEMVELCEEFSCGGGGGSFNNGTNQQNECCFNRYGHGRVIITFLQ